MTLWRSPVEGVIFNVAGEASMPLPSRNRVIKLRMPVGSHAFGMIAISLWTMCVAFLGSAVAQEVELQMRIDNWSIYCAKGPANPGPKDCSTVAAVTAEDDPSVWVKLAFGLHPSISGDLPMSLTIRTPRLDFLKHAVLIGVDGQQIGRAFIETCNKDSCSTTVSVDAKMRHSVLAAKSVTFEYQVTEKESVALAVNVEALPKALAELEKTVGLSSPIVAHVSSSTKQPMSFEVQLRTNPYWTYTGSWGEPVPSCGGVPGNKVVYVGPDLKIQNDEQFSKWLNAAKHCSDRFVFWVKQGASAQARDSWSLEAGMYTVYDALRGEVGDVVVSGVSGVPVRFAK
jgi:invasion protein IalB